MKKKQYIKPTIELVEMDNTVLLAGSPKIDPTPSPGGAEACSLNEGNAIVVFDVDEADDAEVNYWGIQ